MAIISCPECGKQISDRAVACPDCGCPINAAPSVVAQPDTSKEIEKLVVLARRAREASDSKNAQKYYGQILDKDPGNWEAIFYSVYFEASECKLRDIGSAANSVANCVGSTFAAIGDLNDEAEKNEAIETVIASAVAIAAMFASAAISHYNQFSTTDNAFSECSGKVVAAGNIYGEIEAGFKKVFPDKKELLSQHQKNYLNFLKANSQWYNEGYLSRTCNRIDNEIAGVHPEHRQKRELEKKISALNAQMYGIQTESKPRSKIGAIGCYLFAGICGVGVMLFLSMGAPGGFVLLYAAFTIGSILLGKYMMKKPISDEELSANIRRKKELTDERNKLQKELDAIHY